MNPYVQCEGLVLAGGQSTRMQGQNKALIELNGAPLLAHAIDQLKDHCTQVSIAAGTHQQQYQMQFGDHRLLQDNSTEGPLAGIIAGLRALEVGQWLITSPCDAPLAGRHWASALLNAQASNPSRQAFYIEHANSPYYAHALWHQSVISILEDALTQGKRSIKGCLSQISALAVTLPIDYQGSFDNLNSAQDVANLRMKLSSTE